MRGEKGRAVLSVKTRLGLAVLSVVPPILLDTLIAPLVLTAIAVVLGILAIRGGETRLGGLALFAASVGGLSGVLFANTDTTTVKNIVTAGLFASTLRFATPLVLGGLGGVICERSGVTNIAIVNAYHAATIVADLAAFNSRFGLPSATLTVINQTGGDVSVVLGGAIPPSDLPALQAMGVHAVFSTGTSLKVSPDFSRIFPIS